MDFKPLDKEGEALIKQYLTHTDYAGSDYTKYGFLIWFDEVEYAEEGGALYLRGTDSEALYYWQPLLKEGVALSEAVERLPEGSTLYFCTQQAAQELGDKYDASYLREWSDYIYSAEDFISLVGKRYNAKRNHIHKFLSQYSYTLAPYKAEDRQALIDFEDAWLTRHSYAGDAMLHESVNIERKIFLAALDGALAGETVCDVLRVDGALAGVTIAEIMPNNNAVVIYEKADISYDGIYSFLAHEFAARRLAGCKYINRQEDLGIEGLRKSKLSYCPLTLLDKYTLTPKMPPVQAPAYQNLCDGICVRKLQKRDFNDAMYFLKTGILSLDDKKHFLNYTDGELEYVLDSGYMLGAFDGDGLAATCAIDFDKEYGDTLKGICGDGRTRQYFELGGVMVRSELRRRGIGTAILKRVLAYAQDNLKGSTLCAVVQYDNLPSLGNLKKQGFIEKARRKQGIYDFIYLTLDID